MATVHNPIHFEPSDYAVEDYLDNQRPTYCGQDMESWKQEIAWWEADMRRALGADWVRKIHRCVHCGNARVRYITAVLHVPTGDRVVFGADCTARLGFTDRVAFKLAQIKAKAEAGNQRMKVWRQREAFVAARPALAAAIDQAKGDVHAMNTFVHDVIGKLNRYGSLSDKQVAAVVASLAKDVERAAGRAADATEVKGPAPAGRQTVTGTVLTVKDQESDFGWTRKMLVKLANNARVWVTVPSGAGVERGATVTVTATWTPKDDDTSFAFGKRPIVSDVVPPAPVAPATDDPMVQSIGQVGANIAALSTGANGDPDWSYHAARAIGHLALDILGR
jgi:hypothetical protein